MKLFQTYTTPQRDLYYYIVDQTDNRKDESTIPNIYALARAWNTKPFDNRDYR